MYWNQSIVFVEQNKNNYYRDPKYSCEVFLHFFDSNQKEGEESLF